MAGDSPFPNVSVVLLSFNEEVNIRHALESVSWCDDIIVVDSFSTDRTEAICREFAHVRFLQRSFTDLASQRQHVLDADLASHDWILALDADEMVPPELATELCDIAGRFQPGQPVAYDIAMRLVMWGRWLRRSSEYPVYWRRFFRKDAARYVQAGHADKIEVNGPVGTTRHDLIHEDRHDLAHWLAKHNRYSSQEAAYAIDDLAYVPYSQLFSRDRAHRRRALKRLFRFLPCADVVRFLYLYVWCWGFLDGTRGWQYCRLKAQQAYHVSMKIDELRRSRSTTSRQSVRSRSPIATATQPRSSTEGCSGS